MIQRIEHGRVQVNENPSKKKRRPRRRPSRPPSQESEKGRAVKPPIIKATLDFAFTVRLARFFLEYKINPLTRAIVGDKKSLA